MKQVTTIFGHKLVAECIGCEIHHGSLQSYEGSIHSWSHFHAHQDIEVPLPGFVILSTKRHIKSVSEFTSDELVEFGQAVGLIREVQEAAGIKNCYLFQNEDSSDHFHLWFFPVYEWMQKYGKGYSLLAEAFRDVKEGKVEYELHEVTEKIERIKSLFQRAR